MLGNDKMKKVFKILTLSTFALVVGLIVAYYNTSSLGYDNANIISFNNEELHLFDYRIVYEDVEKNIETVKETLFTDFISI